MRPFHWIITILLVIILIHQSASQSVDITIDYESPASSLYVMLKFSSSGGANYITIPPDGREIFTYNSVTPLITTEVICSYTYTQNGQTSALTSQRYSTLDKLPLNILFNPEKRSDYRLYQCIFNIEPGFISTTYTTNEILFSNVVGSGFVLRFSYRDLISTSVAIPFVHVDDPDSTEKAVIVHGNGNARLFLVPGDTYSYSLYVPASIMYLRPNNGLVIFHPFSVESPQIKCYEHDENGDRLPEPHDKFVVHNVLKFYTGGDVIYSNTSDTSTDNILIQYDVGSTAIGEIDRVVFDCDITVTASTLQSAENHETEFKFFMYKTSYGETPSTLPQTKWYPYQSKIVQARPDPFVGEMFFPSADLEKSIATVPIGARKINPMYFTVFTNCGTPSTGGEDDDTPSTSCEINGNRLSFSASFLELLNTDPDHNENYFFTLDFTGMEIDEVCDNDGKSCDFDPSLCPDFTVSLANSGKSLRFSSPTREFIDVSCQIDARVKFSNVDITPYTTPHISQQGTGIKVVLDDDDAVDVPHLVAYAPYVRLEVLNPSGTSSSFRSPFRGGRLGITVYPAKDSQNRLHPILPGLLFQLGGLAITSDEDVYVSSYGVTDADMRLDITQNYALPKMLGPSDLQLSVNSLSAAHILQPTIRRTFREYGVPFAEREINFAFHAPSGVQPTLRGCYIQVDFAGFADIRQEQADPLPAQVYPTPTEDTVLGPKSYHYVTSSHFYPNDRSAILYLNSYHPTPRVDLAFFPSAEKAILHGLCESAMDFSCGDSGTDNDGDSSGYIMSSVNQECANADVGSYDDKFHMNHAEDKNGGCRTTMSLSSSANPTAHISDFTVLDDGETISSLTLTGENINTEQIAMFRFSGFNAQMYDQITFAVSGSIRFSPSPHQTCQLVRLKDGETDETNPDNYMADPVQSIARVQFNEDSIRLVFDQPRTSDLTKSQASAPFTACITNFTPIMPDSHKLVPTDFSSFRFNSSHFSRVGYLGSSHDNTRGAYQLSTSIHNPDEPSYSLHLVSHGASVDDTKIPVASLNVLELRLYNIQLAVNNAAETVELRYSAGSTTPVFDILNDDETFLLEEFLRVDCPGGQRVFVQSASQFIIQIEYTQFIQSTTDRPIVCQFPVGTSTLPPINASLELSVNVIGRTSAIQPKEGAVIPAVGELYSQILDVEQSSQVLTFELNVENGLIYRLLNVLPYAQIDTYCIGQNGTPLGEIYPTHAMSFLLIQAIGSGICKFSVQLNRNSPAYNIYLEAAGSILRTAYPVLDVTDLSSSRVNSLLSHIPQRLVPSIRDPRLGASFTSGFAIILDLYRNPVFVSQRFVIPLPSGTILDPSFQPSLHCDSNYLTVESTYNVMNSTHTLYVDPVRSIQEVDEVFCVIPVTFLEPTLSSTFMVYLTPNLRFSPRWDEEERRKNNVGITNRYDLVLPNISSVYSLQTDVSVQESNVGGYYIRSISFSFNYTSLLYNARSNVLQMDLAPLKIEPEKVNRPVSCHVVGTNLLGDQVDSSVVSYRYSRESGYNLAVSLPPVDARVPVTVRCVMPLTYYGHSLLSAPILSEFPTGAQTVASATDPNFPLVAFETFQYAHNGDKQVYRELTVADIADSSAAETKLLNILYMDILFEKTGFFTTPEILSIRTIVHSIVSLRDQKITLQDIIYLSQSRAPTARVDEELVVRLGFNGLDVQTTLLDVKFAGVDFVRYLSNEFSVLSYSIIDEQPGDVRFGRTQYHQVCSAANACGIMCGLHCSTGLCSTSIECNYDSYCQSGSCRRNNNVNDYLSTPFLLRNEFTIQTSTNSASAFSGAIHTVMVTIMAIMLSLYIVF